jgi:hypothetical protein
MNNLGAGIGEVNKEDLLNLSGNPLDQQIFGFDHNRLSNMKEGASSYTLTAGLQSRLRRDMAIDYQNPRQELPHNPSDESKVDEIKNLIAQQIDLAHPADFKAHDNVDLVKNSYLNSIAEENEFSDPKAMSREQLYYENPSQERRGRNALDFYGFGGSAAGRPTNHLDTDEDGAIVNSVESTVAF